MAGRFQEQLGPVSESREMRIAGDLINIDLQRANPSFFTQLARAAAQALNRTESAGLTIRRSDEITALRAKGKMLSVTNIMLRARSMANLDPKKRETAISEFSDERSEAASLWARADQYRRRGRRLVRPTRGS